MGQQVNFWMTASDELEFVERLQSDDAVWSPQRLEADQEPEPLEFDGWAPAAESRRVIVIRRSDWSRLRCRDKKDSGFPPGWVSEFKPWRIVGDSSSPSFEWDTCQRSSRHISMGRVYFMAEWLDGDVVRKKDPDAAKWFGRVAGWLRRHGIRHQSNGQFLMPEAAALLKSGSLEVARQQVKPVS